MIKGLIVAIQFLTRIPVNINIDFNKENIGKGTFFFPFIGFLIGLLNYFIFLIFKNISIELASIMVVLGMIIFTGGLHLDGLSDMVDGFYSSSNKEKTLKIMEDSRIGAFGVISLIIIILIKFVAIKELSDNLFYPLIISMGNSRLASLIQIKNKHMVKKNGLGDMIHSSYCDKYIISSIVLYIGIMFFLNKIYLIPLIIALLIEELISIYSYKKIGGVTGDIYGATIEITEAISLISFMVVNKWI